MKTPNRRFRGSGPTRCSAGFTLVEFTMVMALFAILAGMAVVSLGWLGSAQETIAAARVRTTLVFAQQWALGSSNRTWVVFDLSNDLVEVFVEDRANLGKSNRLTLADPLTRGALTLSLGPSGIEVSSVNIGGTAEVEFDVLGRPSRRERKPSGC